MRVCLSLHERSKNGKCQREMPHKVHRQHTHTHTRAHKMVSDWWERYGESYFEREVAFSVSFCECMGHCILQTAGFA